MVILPILKFQKPMNGRSQNSMMKMKMTMNYLNTKKITSLTQQSTTGVIINSITTGSLNYMILVSCTKLSAIKIKLGKPDTPDHIT